jgi:hypothetical protein
MAIRPDARPLPSIPQPSDGLSLLVETAPSGARVGTYKQEDLVAKQKHDSGRKKQDLRRAKKKAEQSGSRGSRGSSGGKRGGKGKR